ncbi:MAG: hypothetical protein EOO07_18495, partial [Chitinophagaceae bacterium]
MENQNENKKDVRNDLIDVDKEKDTPRNEENIEKNTSSNPTSKFEKKHGRTNNAFGTGHEPG